MRPFWETLRDFGPTVALIDGRSGEQRTYIGLADAADSGAECLDLGARGLVAVMAKNDIAGVTASLAVWRAGHALVLVPADLSTEAVEALTACYRPAAIVAPAERPLPLPAASRSPIRGYTIYVPPAPPAPIHPDLGLVLRTSGSSGLHQACRITQSGLATNAWQIVNALGLGPTSRALLCLPLAYIYGLSVLTSHLTVGASVVVDGRSVLDSGLIDVFRRTEVNTFAGVTFTLELLRQLDRRGGGIPPLLKLMHSGSSMGDDLLEWLKQLSEDVKLQIFRMYGMTEAAGRMTVLPPDLFRAHPRSVGRPVCGAEIKLGPSGEVIYRGPNVMYGYAGSADDLVRGDDLGGVLDTGDLGELDSNGLLYLTGRSSRLMKMFGRRVSLEAVEARLSDLAPTAAVSDDRRLVIYAEIETVGPLEARIDQLARELQLPRRFIELRRLDALPRTASGKIRFDALSI